MKLILEGHEYKYAVEQSLLTLFPTQKPEYSAPEKGEDHIKVKLSRSGVYLTVTTAVLRGGMTFVGSARIKKEALSQDKLELDRQCQKLIRKSFYRAAVRCTGEESPWGALTGIRPGTIFTKAVDEGLSEKAALTYMMKEHMVSRERAELCMYTSRQSRMARDGLREKDIALYIGIPFCPTRCAYCSFVSASVEKSMALIPPFLLALHREIEELGRIIIELGLRVIAVYIGGGTPTTLSAQQTEELIAVVRKNIDLSRIKEFSLEAGRPDTITAEKLIAMEKCGVDRISINPQTMSDTVLRAIGRKHSADDIVDAFRMAREHTTAQINMDLIAGLPEDTPESFADTLRRTIDLQPENITVHTLALKKGSRITLEGSVIPGKEEVARMLDTASRELMKAGYLPYYLYRQKFTSGGFENVGWAKPGTENLYNILIMEELCTILAAGGGASTKLVDPKVGRVERIFDYKYPKEYIEGQDKMLADKQGIIDFYK